MNQSSITVQLSPNSLSEKIWSEKDIKTALTNKEYNKVRYDSKCIKTQTMLMHAAIFNDYNLAYQLLHNGAKLEMDDGLGKTALYYAVWENNVFILKLLLDAGVNVNCISENMTPLYLATKNNFTDSALMLIKVHANVNALNENKQTALMASAIAGNSIIAERLLKNGANPNLKNKDGATALDIAKFNNHRLVEFVINKYINCN